MRPPTCALLLDRAAAIEVGLFDERYFIGKENGDFTHRIKLADLVGAWNLLRSPNAMLLIAGPDIAGHPWDTGRPARELVARYRLSRSVRFLGPSDDVPSLMHVTDITVQPSHVEAMGLSAAEAACGVPVVASAVGGLLDFIVDGRNGRLTPPQDPRALAATLGEIIADSSLRARLVDRARASVADYDEPTVFGRMANLLALLAAGHVG